MRLAPAAVAFGAVVLGAGLALWFGARSPDGGAAPAGPGPGTAASSAGTASDLSGRAVESAGRQAPAAAPPGGGAVATTAARVAALLGALAGPGDPTAAATELRRLAAADPAVLADLIARLGDPLLARRVREAIAHILGSLPAPEALAALVAALQAGSDPAWLETVLHAVGQDKDDDDPLNQEPGGPFVLELEWGLRVRLAQALDDPHAIDVAAGFVADPAPAARRAAILALEHTLTGGADLGPPGERTAAQVRSAFAGRLAVEPDEGLRACLAKALGDWAVKAPADLSTQPETIRQVIDAALAPDATTVRLRSAPGLGAATVGDREMARLVDAASRRDGDLDTRTWAMDVLARQAPHLPPGECEPLLAALTRSLDDPAPKVRVRALGDPSWNVRVAAARRPRRSGGRRAGDGGRGGRGGGGAER